MTHQRPVPFNLSKICPVTGDAETESLVTGKLTQDEVNSDGLMTLLMVDLFLKISMDHFLKIKVVPF
jgi:hypothetical protein